MRMLKIKRMINDAYSRSIWEKCLKSRIFQIFRLIIIQKDGGESSPYENIKKIYNRAVNFVKILITKQKDFGFTVRQDLEKPLFQAVLQKEIIESGKTVVYSRASRLFENTRIINSAEIPTGAL